MEHSSIPAGRDRKADIALAEWYGEVKLYRSVVDGQRGYTVETAGGVKCFVYRLGTAFRMMAEQLGHGEDRDILVVGEPEGGNAW